jgi:glycosyltransferase involved in cell wall biosynthesis
VTVTAASLSAKESFHHRSDVSRVAIFLPSLRGGGAERVFLTLANGFLQRGISVDLLLAEAVGPYLTEIPPSVRVIDLRRRRVLTSLPRLIRYLRAERPEVLLSTMSHANITALWARHLAGGSTRIIVREANTLGVSTRRGSLRNRLMPWLVRMCYPWADQIVAVSEGVAASVLDMTGLPPSKVRVLPNPIVTPELKARAAEPLDHPWFLAGAPPVILGVGRLVGQKDFPTLIRAFAAVRAQRAARLIILGEGADRPRLESLVRDLGVSADTQLPGRTPNPFSYMARAAVFVLSSAWEGMPGVLIQALACGAPVVATDCESGPREVLAGGKFGGLVPVGDHAALARAITAALDAPRKTLPPEVLEPYTDEASVESYLNLFHIPAAHV